MIEAPKSVWNRLVCDLFVLFVLLLISFFPVFTHQFVYHNDIGIWFQELPGIRNSLFYETGHLLIFGRPIGALLLFVQTYILRSCHGIDSLTYARFISFLFLIGFIGLVDYVFLKHSPLDRFERVVLLSFTFIQPPWLLNTLWLCNLAPGILASIMSVLGAVFFNHFLSEYSKCDKKKYFWLALSIGFLVASCLTYQIAVTLFFWYFLILWIFSPVQFFAKIRMGIQNYAFFGIVCGITVFLYFYSIRDFLCSKNYINCLTWVSENDPNYSLTLPHSLSNKIMIILNSFTLLGGSWFVTLSKIRAEFVGVTVVLIFIAFKRLKSSVAVILSCIVFSISFLIANLATNGELLAFRTLIPMTIFIGIGMVSLLAYIKSKAIKQIVMIFLVGANVLSAYLISDKYCDFYERAWYSLVNTPNLTELCQQQARSPEIASHYLIHTSITPPFTNFLTPQADTANSSFDFGLEPFVAWGLSGVCHLLVIPPS